MWLGIDFGTTNSAIAFSDGARVHTFKVDGRLPDLLPSLLYITKHYEEYSGSAARELYLEKNVDRPSQYKPFEVGVIRLDVGDGSGYREIQQVVTVLVDVLAPGRLFRSIKTGLRTFEYEGSNVFSRYYRVEELIAILLKHLLRVAEPMFGESVDRIVMGRPVKFSENPDIDRRAQERLLAAAKLAGIEEVVFLPEPVAAAYAYHRDFERPMRSFIFDFGGGTLDLTVAQLGGEQPRVLATEGVLIGGDDLDKRLLQHLLPYFGQGARLYERRPDGRRVERPIPRHIWGSLLDWQTVEEMKRTEALGTIEAAAEAGGSTNPAGMRALYDLVYRNLYYKLLREIERVKVALSTAESAPLKFRIGAVDIDETITRNQFESLINMEVSTIATAIDRVVAQAGIRCEDIEQVVATGGSSQIPIFKRLLAEKFARAAVATRGDRNMTGVVQGLAIYGHDVDVERDDVMVLIRPRLFDKVQQAPVQLPVQGREQLEERVAFSHAAVGFNANGAIQLLPYRSGRPLAVDYAVRMKDAVFVSRAGKVLLGSTLTKFVLTDLNSLYDTVVDPNLTPYQLRLDRERAEEYTFVQRWQPSAAPLTILVSRWGNVRAFPTRLVYKPLEEQGLWQLDMRGSADPPALLLPAQRHSTLLLMSEEGSAVRMRASHVSVRGGRGLWLKRAQGVYALCAESPAEVIVIGADGRGATLDPQNVPQVDRKGGHGKQVVDRLTVVSLLPATAQGRGLTSKGRLVELDLSLAGVHKIVRLEIGEQLVRCW